MRGVESAPPGDVEWALHYTRQQALVLSLQLSAGEPPTLDQLAEVLDVVIYVAPDLPMSSISLTNDDRPSVIIVDGKQPIDDHLRLALRGVKKIVDRPARDRMGVEAFPEQVYESLADAFAEVVLRPSDFLGDDRPSERHDLEAD